MVNWFVNKKDAKGRLVRAVKYLKDWADKQSFKMTSGLALTILASNAKELIVLNERDDITLRDILKEIQKELNKSFKCIVPSIPNDDLLGNYVNKDKFLNALDKFIEDAESSIRNTNQKEASRLWRKHLGNRFPLGEDKEENTSYGTAAAAIGTLTLYPFGHE